MMKIKIILVDDEPDILEMCQGLLVSEGYDVRCALNGPEAINMFRNESADIVVTDVRMPGMDGLEVLRAVKTIDDLAEVIILTGHASVDTAVTALKNDGAFDFLTKPLEELDDLLITVEKALVHRGLRVENALLLEELSQNQIHMAKQNKALRRAKKELEHSRQRYRDLYHRAPVGYVAVTTNHEIKEVNQTAAALFGLSTDAMRYMVFTEFVAPEWMDTYEKFCEQLGETTSVACELALSKANGESFFAHIEGVSVPDAGGNTRQLRMTLSDISSQKKVELALQESEKRYRTLMETIPHGIEEIDVDGNITFVNAGYAAIHGYSADELVGKSVADLTGSKSEGQDLLYYLKTLSKTLPLPSTWFGRIRTREGELKDIEVDWNYKRDAGGDVVGFVSVLSDITERKKAESALRDSEVRYRSFVENFNGIAFRMTLEGAPVFYHGVVQSIAGYTEQELVDSNPGWEALIHPEELSLVRMRRKRVCLAGAQSITQEYRICHRDGQWRWVREHIQNTCGLDGQPTAIQGVIFDITDYKHLQTRYYETRKLESIATLAGGIAHQFNNALAGLMGNVELLEMDMREQSSSKGRKYTQAMMQMIQRMSQLTGQLLAYARGGKYLPSSVRLGDLVKQSLNLLHHRISPELEIEIELSVESDLVRADTTQLQMVFLAIMDNAMEAVSHKGCISIKTREFKPTIDFRNTYPDRTPCDHICLTICDNGCGMDEHTRLKIFEPFFSTKFVGRGLGLSAAYGIIANHDGWMDVASEPGKGASVSIYLPIIRPEKQAPVSKALQQPLHGDATILVVEDEVMVIKAVRKLLEKLHYRVLEALTGHTALEMLRTFNGQVDAVLLDIRLPDMDADELYAKMLKIRPDIRVVVCSGYDKDGPAEALLDAGALAFLRKPFSIKTLAAKLREIMNNKDGNKEAIDVATSKQDGHQHQSHLKLV